MAAVLLGVFLLVVLMEGETSTAHGDSGGDLLLDPVRPGILWVLLRLMLLVQRVCSGGNGAELGELFHVLVVLAAGLCLTAASAVAPHYERTSFHKA